MRADEPMTSVQMFAMLEDGTLLNYINQLRVDRLMAKDEKYNAISKKYVGEIFVKSKRIGNAHEARAKRIKDGM